MKQEEERKRDSEEINRRKSSLWGRWQVRFEHGIFEVPARYVGRADLAGLKV